MTADIRGDSDCGTARFKTPGLTGRLSPVRASSPFPVTWKSMSPRPVAILTCWSAYLTRPS